MTKILFVDDEKRVLEGLRRMLRRHRREWDMTFVESGKIALETMAEEDFDVVVSDMIMPGMDGAALLTEVRARHPETVRIVLSGHTELDAAMRTVPVAHQFLTKPCDSNKIREVITRSCQLQSLLDDAVLRRTIGGIDTLPALPRVFEQLMSALQDPEVCLDDVARIVEEDSGITAKILQLVNSSFFGIAQNLTGVRQATTYLGLAMLRNLTLSMGVFRAFEQTGGPHGFSPEREQQHALLTSRIVRLLLPGHPFADVAFLAAMLHDIGKLVFAAQLPEQYAEATDLVARGDRTTCEAEKEVIGVTHAEAGAYLLGLWGMPHPVVEAVAHHHHPARVEHDEFDVLGAVHVASALALETTRPEGASETDHEVGLDVEFMRAMGVEGQLGAWREFAQESGKDPSAVAS